MDEKDHNETSKIRRQAEERLRRTSKASSPGIDIETQRLVHELEVHQVELEMQNSELRQARYEMEKALAEYTDLYDFAPVGYVTLDRDGMIRAANLTAADLLGIRRSELLGLRFGKFVTVLDRPALQSLLDQVFTSHVKESCEIKLLSGGGPPLFLHVDALAAASGAECRMALIDISLRRTLEKVVSENEERLRLALDAAYVISFEWDIQRNEVRRFVSHEPAFSVTSEEDLGTFEEVVAVVHPDDRELFRANIAAALSSENGDYESEHRVVRPDGEVVWLFERGRVKHNEAGQPVRLIGLSQDVSQRKLADAALRDSEELYRAVGESIDYGVWVCDSEGRNTYASPSFLKLVGLTQEQCSNFGWGDALHPDDAERTIAAWKECARTGSLWDIEHRYRGVDGQWHPVLARGIPVRDDERNIKFWAGINLDIADLKKVEGDLAAAKLTAEEANRAKSEFLANMSHEIRTPMSVFMGAIEHLQEIDQTPEHSVLLKMAQESAQRLRVLIDSILDLSRIEAQGMEVEEVEFDLRSCLHSAVDLFTLVAGKKNLSLATEVAADVPSRVVGDPDKVGQVLINLIGNALKFTHEGEVRVTVVRRTDALEFAVADTGIGIPEEKQHQLFQSFSQTDSTFQRQYGGSGLGLAISKGLIQLLGGEITVQSQEGRGSIFTFTLPLKTLSESQGAASAEIPPEEPLRNSSARILLAEDDPMVLEFMSLILAQRGWQAETATTGREAVEKWEAGDFNLILMDLQMPEMDGIEATLTIREREAEKKQRISIIGLTAHARREIMDECLQSGMDMVLTKPVQIKGLCSAIDICLSEKRDPTS